MKVLITGGTGFLGAETTRQLLEAGHDAVVFSTAPQVKELERLMGERARKVVAVPGDVADLDSVMTAARDNQVSEIVHLASFLADRSVADPARAVRVNSLGTTNVFEAARLLGIRRVVWASSYTAIDGYAPDVCLTEETPLYPTGLYGACKAFDERVAVAFEHAYGLDTIGLRFGLLNGLRRAPGIPTQLVAELVAKPVLGLPARVLYADDVPDWIWVEDVARAVLLALEVPSHSHLVYNLKGDSRSIRECALFVQSKIPTAQFTFEPGARKFYHNVDASLIEREMGFTTRWTMEAQFERLIELLKADHVFATKLASLGA